MNLKRRDILTLLGGGAAAWPLAARAQTTPLPVVGFMSGVSRDMAAERPAAFRKGLAETGFVEGQNVTVEYKWLDGQYDQVPTLVADWVRRRAAVIVAPGTPPVVAVAAKAATSTIPIVFSIGDDPVKFGLVASLARPGGNATGVNSFTQEVNTKRLALLHELVPKAVRIAVMLNPARPDAEPTLRDVHEAAPGLGLQIQELKASTNRDIDAAFASLARAPADALFVSGDAFFDSRRVQFVVLASRLGLPTSFPSRDGVEAGLLMSYGTDIIDSYRQVAVYAGRILKGEKPAEMPVMQATKFELAINLQTARALGIEVPPSLLALADEVIE
jgi:putative ABC transport system substrate-binding protein